ncbi:MAG: hypothetical protein ACRDKG_08140 [Actinomycetota bacterium]
MYLRESILLVLVLVVVSYWAVKAVKGYGRYQETQYRDDEAAVDNRGLVRGRAAGGMRRIVIPGVGVGILGLGLYGLIGSFFPGATGWDAIFGALLAIVGAWILKKSVLSR